MKKVVISTICTLMIFSAQQLNAKRQIICFTDKQIERIQKDINEQSVICEAECKAVLMEVFAYYPSEHGAPGCKGSGCECQTPKSYPK